MVSHNTPFFLSSLSQKQNKKHTFFCLTIADKTILERTQRRVQHQHRYVRLRTPGYHVWDEIDVCVKIKTWGGDFLDLGPNFAENINYNVSYFRT